MVIKIREKIEQKEKEQAIGECHHHWIIEAARGPMSHGWCKLCGMEKDFMNAVPEMPIVRRKPPVAVFPEFAEAEKEAEELPLEETEEAEAEGEEVTA